MESYIAAIAIAIIQGSMNKQKCGKTVCQACSADTRHFSVPPHAILITHQLFIAARVISSRIDY